MIPASKTWIFLITETQIIDGVLTATELFLFGTDVFRGGLNYFRMTRVADGDILRQPPTPAD